MFNCFNLAYQHAIESVAKLSGKKVGKNIKKEGIKKTIGKLVMKFQACNLRLLLPLMLMQLQRLQEIYVQILILWYTKALDTLNKLCYVSMFQTVVDVCCDKCEAFEI